MERKLVERAMHGDEGAFDALIERVGDELHSVARRILRDPYLAEDATQRALLDAWRNLPRAWRAACRRFGVGESPLLSPGGLLIINDLSIEAEPERSDIEAVRLPCTQLARTAGDDRYVSVVALGGLVARRPIVTMAPVEAALAELVAGRPEILKANLAAFAAGYERARVGAAV